MPVPLTIAAPAAAAAAAYLNARTQLVYDVSVLSTIVKGAISAKSLDRRDRVNLFYRLEEHARNPKLANHTFIIFEGRKWTFKETYEIVLSYGSWLKTRYGIASKQVVALDYMNSARFLFMILGLWSIGAVPALINYSLTSKALLHCVRTSTARLLIVDEELKDKLTPDVLEELTSGSFYGDGKGAVEVLYHDAALEGEIARVPAKRQPDSCRSGAGINQGYRTSILMYTSGTTGLPKAAVVSWQKSWGSAQFMMGVIGLRKDDVYYTCMPLYHATALILGVMPCLINGLTSAIGRRFSNKTFWPEVRRSKATVIQYVGETCRYLVAAPPEFDPVTGENLDKVNAVRLAFGNGMRPDVWQRFKDRFDIETIAEFYGATEAPGAAFNVSSNDFSRGAIGKRGALLSLLANTTTAIVEIDWESEMPKRDPNSQFCTKVPTNTPGELLFVVDPADLLTKYQGYFGNEKASSSKILRDVFQKGDAWFRTGDCIRSDGDGFTWFCDRIGDTFRWRSENVSTSEVSEVLGHHPAITEANVYGVEVPQHDGRCGCAAVTFNVPVDEPLLKSVAQQATTNLPRYAVPVFLRVLKEMHSTGNNKQQKQGLRVQGINPATVDGEDRMLWLKDGTYVDFGPADYKAIQAGQVKL